jgi:DNA-binding NtrC family response regulator
VQTDSVYLLHLDNTSYVKIGIAFDVQARMKALQTASPMEIRLLAHTVTSFAADLERSLHQHLNKYRVRGEWFSLPLEDAQRIFAEFSAMALIDEAMGLAPKQMRTFRAKRKGFRSKSIGAFQRDNFRKTIVAEYKQSNGTVNRSELAKRLGIGRTTLYELISEAKQRGELAAD